MPQINKAPDWSAGPRSRPSSGSDRGPGSGRPATGSGTGGAAIGVVAAARELTTLVFYGLRDHHIRALDTRTIDTRTIDTRAVSPGAA